MNSKALVLFAREPKLGAVKTRLAKSISAESVLTLYEAFVKDVANLCLSVPCESHFLYYTGSSGGKIPFLSTFEDKFILRRQSGKNLGEHMLNCFQDCEDGGYEKVVVVGSDCLTMTSEEIRNAFDALDKHDFVLGPSTDGGFYLIGSRKFHKKMFSGVKWGEASVFKQTYKNLKRGKKQVFLLDEKTDIDRIDDLYTFAKAVETKHVSLYTKTALRKVFKDLSSKSAKRTQTTRRQFPI